MLPFSRSVGILFHPVFKYWIVRLTHDLEGRLLLVNIDMHSEQYRLINVYAPNNSKKRKRFIRNLRKHCYPTHRLILAGEFNFVETFRLDKVRGDMDSGDIGIEEISFLKNDFSKSRREPELMKNWRPISAQF